MAIPTVIEGLPNGVVIRSVEVDRLLERGALRLVVVPGRRPGILEMSCHPIGGGASAYLPRDRDGRVSYHDPERCDLQVQDEGTDIARRYPVPLDGVSTQIGGAEGEDLIYRGMRDEEMDCIVSTGEVLSGGEWNLDGQDGLTYWSTDPAAAASYANAFAPMHCRPTFDRPAWVVSARRPLETRHVPGVGEHEVGVARAVAVDEIVAVWRGRVIEFNPGSIELVERDGSWTTGSMSQPSAWVAWERLDEFEMRDKLGLPMPGPSPR